MAVSTLSQIAGAIAQTFAKDGNRLWNREAALVSQLPKKMGIGKAVYWTVSNSGAVAATVAEGADVAGSEFTISDKLPMSLNRGIYRSAFGLTHTELAAAESAKNSSDMILELLGESFLDKFTAMASKINVDAWTGTGTDGSSNNNIVGLLSALNAAGTYAGQTSISGLQANVQSSVGTLTVADLDLAFSQIFTKSGTVPDFGRCSASTARQYQALFTSPQQFNHVGQGLPRFDLSQGAAARSDVPVLWYRGVPILQDKDCPDGYMVFGRNEDLELDVLQYGSYGDAVSIRRADAISSNGEEMAPIALPLHVYPLAKTGSSVKFAVECEIQMKVKRPNAFALLTGISTP